MICGCIGSAVHYRFSSGLEVCLTCCAIGDSVSGIVPAGCPCACPNCGMAFTSLTYHNCFDKLFCRNCHGTFDTISFAIEALKPITAPTVRQGVYIAKSQAKLAPVAQMFGFGGMPTPHRKGANICCPSCGTNSVTTREHYDNDEVHCWRCSAEYLCHEGISYYKKRNPTTLPQMPVVKGVSYGAMTCKKCKNSFPDAAPNQDDGTLVCYSCRSGW